MKAKDYNMLKKLRILELSILLQHLRLGKEHINKYLNNQQFSELTKFDGLSNEQREHMAIEEAEKSGNFALALNTLFTCIVGGWLGMAGFMGAGLGSTHFLLTITLIAAVSSAYLGYYNYKSVKKQAKDAIIDQKLYNIQLNLIKTINKRRRHQIKKLINYLNSSFQQLSEDSYSTKAGSKKLVSKFESKEEIIEWLNRLNSFLENKANKLPEEIVYQLYLDELADCKNHLKSILSKNIALKEKTTKSSHAISATKQTLTNVSWQLKEEGEEKSFIKVLTDPTIAIPQTVPKKRSWLGSNFIGLLVGLLPTVLGGFGSMFVYFGGIPSIAKEMGINSLEILAKHPLLKPLELSVAIIITLYFGYTFALSNYKNFQREQEIEKTQKNITNEETSLIEIHAKLNLLRKMKQQVLRLLHVFRILTELSSAMDEKAKQLEEYRVKNKFLEKQITELQEKIRSIGYQRQHA